MLTPKEHIKYCVKRHSEAVDAEDESQSSFWAGAVWSAVEMQKAYGGVKDVEGRRHD
jgi:hypothetical protein